MNFEKMIPKIETSKVFSKKFLTCLSTFILSITSMEVSAKGLGGYENDNMSRHEIKDLKKQIIEIKEVYAKYEDYIKNSGQDTVVIDLGSDKKIKMYHSGDGYAVALEEQDKQDPEDINIHLSDGNFISNNKTITGSPQYISNQGTLSYILYDANKDGIVDVIEKQETNYHGETFLRDEISEVKEILDTSYPAIVKSIGSSIDIK